MKIESVDVLSLIFDSKNARKHDGKNLRSIRGSLVEFGQQKPLVVGANNVVLAGNGTLEEAIKLGWEKIDIVRTNLTGKEALAYALADNRTAELASWSEGVLVDSLLFLTDGDFDVAGIGFDESDFNGDTGTNDSTGKDEEIKEQFSISVSFKNSADQEALFIELRDRGFKVKVI